MDIKDLTPGDRIWYWFDEERKATAIIGEVRHQDTEDNARPRVSLVFLHPNFLNWTKRHSVKYIDSDPEVPKQGHWEEY